ncbi:MAG: DNRLRE domain-containing protein [bacterium]
MFELIQPVLLCALLALGPKPAPPAHGTAAEARHDLSTVQLEPVRDNSMYENSGTLSNGAGIYLFSGVIQDGFRRRCLLRFDLSGIPANASIQDARLTLTVSNSISGAVPMTLHRALADWGEAGSDAGTPGGLGAPAQPGDATWTHAFYPSVMWSAAGGDFDATASATTSVAGLGSYQWSDARLIADVQSWVTGALPNFGWILLGDESASGTAKRFDSREFPTPASRPMLTVQYFAPTTIDAATWAATKALYR